MNTLGFKANYIETKQSTYHLGTEYCFLQITRQKKRAVWLTWGTDIPAKASMLQNNANGTGLNGSRCQCTCGRCVYPLSPREQEKLRPLTSLPRPPRTGRPHGCGLGE